MKTLTIRDHYVLAALNGLVQRVELSSLIDAQKCTRFALYVDNIVDAMLEAREERMKDE